MAVSYPAYGGKGPALLKEGWSLGAIATILIALRVYTRLKVNKKGTVALIWALCAWALTIITQSVATVAILHGLGNHIDVVVETGEVSSVLFYTWMTFFFFIFAIAIGKAAFCAFLLEIQAGTNKFRSGILYFLAIFNVVATIPLMFLNWFQCTPSRALWDPVLRETHCPLTAEVIVPYTYFIGAVAAVTDLILALLPIWIIWPLQMDWRIKAGLCVLMSTGVFAGAAAILRTIAARSILAGDATYSLWQLFLWGELEEWVVMMAMCVPPIWPLFRPVVQRVYGNATKTPTPSNGRTGTAAQRRGLPSLVTSGHYQSSSARNTYGASPRSFQGSFSASPIESASVYSYDSPTKKSPMWSRAGHTWLELDDIKETDREKDLEYRSALSPQEVHVRRDVSVSREARKSSDTSGLIVPESVLLGKMA